MIVRKSTIPSKESRNLILARHFLLSGYKKAAVHIRRIYSIQKMNTVIYSIAVNKPENCDNCEKVSIKVTAILQMIVMVIKISKKLFLRLDTGFDKNVMKNRNVMYESADTLQERSRHGKNRSCGNPHGVL